MIRVEWADPLDQLLSAEEYANWVDEEENR
jgi:hypothetical protein